VNSLDLIINGEDIKNRIKELSDNFTYKDINTRFVCVLNGAFMFFSELIKNFSFPTFIDFIKVKSYKGTESMNMLEWILGPNLGYKDEKVVIVDDIYDSGLTINSLVKYFKGLGAKEVKTCVLLNKKESELADYMGFQINKEFVVGYGLDYFDRYRNLNGIYRFKVDY
jgi:hypoxanthine phosphoribosyltransferase